MVDTGAWALPDEFREGLTDENGDPLSKTCGFFGLCAIFSKVCCRSLY